MSAYKATKADSLVWNIGYVKTLVELGVDPTDILKSIYDKYEHDSEFVDQLKSGQEFALKMNKDGQYRHRNRIAVTNYEGNVD